MVCPACRAENPATATTCKACGATLPATPTQVVVTIDLSPGVLFHNRYEILGQLGRGGMGMVYKARDRTLDEVVAIKVLRPDFAEDPKMAERFKSEIKLARKVRNKNVCAIHDYGEDRGVLYISMEFIEGVDLKHILREKGGLPPDRAYDIAIQVADGLQAVHEAGIIHRDLKSPNIMLDPHGVARLMDFGIAKREGVEGTMTATGNIVGTPEYMSPEQAQGLKLDFRSDVYALGVVTWEIFTGHVPFHGETPLSTILKHLREPPPLDGPLAAALPLALKPVLRKALAKEVSERFASAGEFAEALRQAKSPSRRQQPVSTVVLQAPTVTAPVAPTMARPLVPKRSRAWIGWAVAAAALVVVGGFLAARPWSSPAPVANPPATSPPAPTPGPPQPTSTPAATAAVSLATATPAERSPTPSPVIRPTPVPTRAPAISTPTPSATRRPTPAAPPPTTPPSATPGPLPAAAGSTVTGIGYLLVTVQPWATVILDGVEKGQTPLDKIPLAAGTHRVVLRFPTYEPVEKAVLIRPDQTERIVFNFVKDGVKKP